MNNQGLPIRTFLRMLADGDIAGYAGTGTYATQVLFPEMSTVSLNGPLSYEIFAALLNDIFYLYRLDPKSRYRAQIKLVEANSLFLSSENDQFNLIFATGKNPIALNETYRLQHASAGDTTIFLQPALGNRPGNFCRADFNLLL